MANRRMVALIAVIIASYFGLQYNSWRAAQATEFTQQEIVRRFDALEDYGERASMLRQREHANIADTIRNQTETIRNQTRLLEDMLAIQKEQNVAVQNIDASLSDMNDSIEQLHLLINSNVQ